MSEEVARAVAQLLRTIGHNAEMTARHVEMIAKLIEPKEELPESSRSSHYS